MTERAAHLVDHVFPDVPVRQWVLSLPPKIRYLLAWHHDLCKALVGVLLREVNRHLRDRARARGLVDPRGGAVAIVQRFGGALNLNIHVHALVLDGVFARAEDGRLAFHETPSLTDADVAEVLAAIEPGVTRLVARRGFGDDGDRSDGFAEATPLLAGLAAASVQGLVALGRAPGTRPQVEVQNLPIELPLLVGLSQAGLSQAGLSQAGLSQAGAFPEQRLTYRQRESLQIVGSCAPRCMEIATVVIPSY